VIGWWEEGLREPIGVTTNLSAEQRLRIYLQRMKIEAAFRDLENLLGLETMMDKKRTWMEKMLAWVLMAYAIALILGEILRAPLVPEHSCKSALFSGPFVFLKLKLNRFPQEFRQAFPSARAAFRSILVPVRTHVGTSVYHLDIASTP